MTYNYHKTEQLKQIAAEWRMFIQGRRFVWLMMPPWDSVWTRQNHFALRLAELGAEILYVEQPVSLTRFARQRRLPDRYRPQIRSVHERIQVMTPSPVVPGSMKSDLIAELVGRQIGGAVSEFLRQNRWDRYACWHRLPASLYATRHLEPAPAMRAYDMTDDYSTYVSGQRAENVRRRERELLQMVDLVLVTSPALLRLGTAHNKNIFFIPNGVDYELFAQVGTPAAQRDPSVAHLKSPVIGYVGLIKDWINLDLVAQISERWPGQVLFVGPFDAGMEEKARAIPGIHWTGFVERSNLIGYLEAMDICTIPFHVNDQTRASYPLKLWEYMATGRPVVSTDLPAARAGEDLVDIARSEGEFVALIDWLLTQGEDPARGQARRDLARQYSWDNLFQSLLTHLRDTVEKLPTA